MVTFVGPNSDKHTVPRILDKYILKGYLPLLSMTFLISWFIVLMQFLWKYVDELVGKGLGVWVVAKTVFYAAMSLVPLSLPLGILLASLMFFGQIGERLELLAMKASGLPLYRIMAPLFVAVLALSLGLFYFQNTYMITSQVRMWTLLYSARYATPELEVPEGVFYNGIPGYSIYVGKRDKVHTGRLLNVMLYDHKQGNERTRIIRADSGRIVMDASQKYLTWRLYQGQSFENMNTPSSSSDPRPTSYAKEHFGYKEIVIHFDANFKVQDESAMSSRFVGKDLGQLSYAIDTVTYRIDSIRQAAASQLVDINDRLVYSYALPAPSDTSQIAQKQRQALLGSDTITTAIRLDSLMAHSSLQDSLNTLRGALSALQQMRNESESRLFIDKDAYFDYRTNRQEWHRKFTFPVACLVFFFIGAPLGAIIRRGGLGVPVVVSVMFFIVYYIIDTFGHNMISSEKMDVVPGMWLSTWVLLPIGALLTWQATRDSASLNMEAYTVLWRKLIGSVRVRKLEMAELIIEEVDYVRAERQLKQLAAQVASLRSSPWLAQRFLPGRLLIHRWLDAPEEQACLEVYEALEACINELKNSRERMIVARLQDIPVLMQRVMPVELVAILERIQPPSLRKLTNLLLPISWPLVGLLDSRRRQLLRDLKTVDRLLHELIEQIQAMPSQATTDHH